MLASFVQFGVIHSFRPLKLLKNISAFEKSAGGPRRADESESQQEASAMGNIAILKAVNE